MAETHKALKVEQLKLKPASTRRKILSYQTIGYQYDIKERLLKIVSRTWLCTVWKVYKWQERTEQTGVFFCDLLMEAAPEFFVERESFESRGPEETK